MTGAEIRKAALDNATRFLGSDAVSSAAVIEVAEKFSDYIEYGKGFERSYL